MLTSQSEERVAIDLMKINLSIECITKATVRPERSENVKLGEKERGGQRTGGRQTDGKNIQSPGINRQHLSQRPGNQGGRSKKRTYRGNCTARTSQKKWSYQQNLKASERLKKPKEKKQRLKLRTRRRGGEFQQGPHSADSEQKNKE